MPVARKPRPTGSIYDSLTGNLFFDVNGSRPAGRVLFAVVAPELDLTHLDFALI